MAGVRASVYDGRLRAAATALANGRLAEAEDPLRQHLREYPTDVAAMRMLAELGARLGRYADAAALLERALELAPSFGAARHNLAVVLHRQNQAVAALKHLRVLLAADPDNPELLNLEAACLSLTGEYADAIERWERLTARLPREPRLHLSLGHALKTVGRSADAVARYARAAALAPMLGEAWFALANMKTYRFTPADVQAMRDVAALGDLGDEDRLHLEFALGKAAEDAVDPAAAFGHYARGNAIGARRSGYDPDETSALADRYEALLTPGLFDRLGPGGNSSSAPIFVVGLPRAGSTLVEQILASHPQVEGTAELPDLPLIARRLAGNRRPGEPARYPALLAELSPAERAELGAEYLDRTRPYRKTGRPRFIDKTPGNWAHAALIHLILPGATIIDVRRHPLANGWSAFRQHFARGSGFTYDLGWLGRYWRDYARVMAALDRALPGRVHRVQYEKLVAAPEPPIRALLAHCGLPFDAACLSPHETRRAIRTPSAEQVRRPISDQSVEEWQQYAAFLQPLIESLGDALDDFRATPEPSSQ